MSTLIVENLKGPTTGANANKVIVPSGQTLLAQGHVLQSQSSTFNGSSTNSTSMVAMSTCGSITTTEANSKIYVNVAAQMQTGRNTQHGLGVGALRSSADSYASDLHLQAIANYMTSSNGWVQGGGNFHILHSPNVAAGTTITYKIYGRRQATDKVSLYVIDAWGLGAFGQFSALELAP